MLRAQICAVREEQAAVFETTAEAVAIASAGWRTCAGPPATRMEPRLKLERIGSTLFPSSNYEFVEAPRCYDAGTCGALFAPRRSGRIHRCVPANGAFCVCDARSDLCTSCRPLLKQTPCGLCDALLCSCCDAEHRLECDARFAGVCGVDQQSRTRVAGHCGNTNSLLVVQCGASEGLNYQVKGRADNTCATFSCYDCLVPCKGVHKYEMDASCWDHNDLECSTLLCKRCSAVGRLCVRCEHVRREGRVPIVDNGKRVRGAFVCPKNNRCRERSCARCAYRAMQKRLCQVEKECAADTTYWVVEQSGHDAEARGGGATRT